MRRGCYKTQPQLADSQRLERGTGWRWGCQSSQAPHREREKVLARVPPPPPPPPPGRYLLGTILSDQSHLGGPVLLGHHSHLGWDVIALFFHLRKVSNARLFGWRALLGGRGGWERRAQADTCHRMATGRPGLSPLSPPAQAPHPRAAAAHRGPARSPRWPPARHGRCACAWPGWRSAGRSCRRCCRCRACSVCAPRGAYTGSSTR